MNVVFETIVFSWEEKFTNIFVISPIPYEMINQIFLCGSQLRKCNDISDYIRLDEERFKRSFPLTNVPNQFDHLVWSTIMCVFFLCVQFYKKPCNKYWTNAG